MGTETASLYDQLGGELAVMAAVQLFYEKVLADPVTSPFFEGLNMETQTTKQIAFMTMAFDGPPEYHGRDLRAAHRRLVMRGLGDAHFDAVAGHLQETLRELDVEDRLIGEVMALVGGTRAEVLGR